MAAVAAPVRQPLTTIGEQNASVGFAATQQPQNQLYDDLPIVVHANEQKALKSEDVIYVRRVEATFGNVHSIFMVCDGHGGAAAANHCVEHMPGLLGQLLPPGLPDWRNMREVVDYSEKVRRAISTAAVLLDNEWARMNETAAGTTLTMCVVSGWLLTVANTGDSNAVIDSGDAVQEITFSHRIQVNKNEQNRLRQSGAQLAPLGFHLQGPAKPQEMGVGPLRMWPGGLCVSRSIGDLDAGPLIVPLPHIRQVLLTRHRALRLIMASDGLWDLMTFSKAAKSVRHKLPHQAVGTLVQMVARDKRMADDVSIIIVDLLPPPALGIMPQQFPASALQAGSKGGSSSGGGGGNHGSSGGGRPHKSSGGGGLFSCFKSPAVNDSDTYHSATGAAPSVVNAAVVPTGPLSRPWSGLEFLADVDCYEAYPVHGQQLARTSVPISQPPPKKQGDYTVHGGQAHTFQQDSSWHTGNSEHGANNLPIFLSQQQLEALQANGPAAAAGMVLNGGYANNNNGHHGMQQHHAGGLYGPGDRGQGTSNGPGSRSGQQGTLFGGAAAAQQALGGIKQGSNARPPRCDDRESMLRMMGSAMFDNNLAARGSSSDGSSGVSSTGAQIMSLQDDNAQAARSDLLLDSRPSQRMPTEHYNAGAAAGGGSSSSRAIGPASPAPGALLRSASAEFENPDGSGVYVAGDEEGCVGGKVAAPGRVVGVKQGGQAGPSHFGSAPAAGSHRISSSRGGGGQGGPNSLAAAARAAEAEEEEEGLRKLGVRSALMDEYTGGGGGGGI